MSYDLCTCGHRKEKKARLCRVCDHATRRAPVPAIDRILRRLDKGEQCWIWPGATTNRGYAKVFDGKYRGHTEMGHRVVYEHFHGPIPAGYDIDHLCSVTRCLNPAHLEAVTPAENRRRQTERKTHCKHGHPLSGDNLYLHQGARHCKTCRREAQRRSSSRRAA